jgi:two-component system chemotaxis sensor kinase CheA
MEDPAVLAEFIAEAREHLAALTDRLLALENLPEGQTQTTINPLFRAMHSLKGSAGFLGFQQLEQLAHSAETLLDAMRKGTVAPAPVVTDLLLKVADRLQARVDGLPESEKADPHQDSELLDRLKAVASGIPAPQPPPKTPAGAVPQNTPTPPAKIPNSIPEIDPALLAEFVAEAREHLGLLSSGLLALESADEEPVNQKVDPLFRATHSIKGSAGFLGFKGLERLAHSTETLLDGLRKGTVAPSQPVADLLLRVTDRMMSAVGKLPADNPAGHDDLIQKIQNVIIGGRPDSPAPDSPASKTTPTRTQPTIEQTATAADTGSAERSATLRVPVEVIDRLMNLASELVLARNQALETLVTPADARGRQLLQRISSVTTDLQQAVMLTRMQPVGTVFNRFPRMVRDLSRSLGKRIHLSVIGSEVELDKSVLEKLVDPLNHLVRNACDHGLEIPEIRQAAGKTEVGNLDLIARQEGGQILVRISDDGRGIDPGRVKAKALEKGLVTPQELEGMSDTQAQALILKPGFSTADKVTDISGRGVGLDVVKTNLESIGGTLQIDSVPGQGTTFSLRLPLTLAIIPALVVRASGERVCLPQRDLVELVSAANLHAREMGDRFVVELRGQPLETIHLGRVLGLDPSAKPSFNRSGFLAVVRAANRVVALAVDELSGSQEIVVKPLHPLLRGLGLHGGATVLADGLPAPILDVEGVVRAAGSALLVTDHSIASAAPSRMEIPSQSAVVFDFGPSERFAVPLSLLSRVDRVLPAQLERIGTRQVARLEAGNLSMVFPNEVLPVSAPETLPGELFLLTPKDCGKVRALVATSILDTTNIPLALDPAPFESPGILGSARLGGRLTLVVHPGKLLANTPQEVPQP